MTTSIHRLIGAALAARNRIAPATPCLDADTAAAFVDDTLSADERSGAEAHVADCSRCQALLAALARTAPAAAPRVWWRRPAVAWLAPVATAAAAAIVWINVSSDRSPLERADSVAREGTRAQAAASSPVPPAPRESVSPLIPNAGAAPSAARAPSVPEERRSGSRDGSETSVSRQERLLADSRVGEPAAGRAASGSAVPSATPEQVAAVAPSTAPAATANAGPGAEVPQTPLPSTRAARTQAFEVPPPLAASETDSATAAPPRSLSESVTVTAEAMERAPARQREAAREVTIVSPDPLARWRIGTDGSVQHSSDGGATWQAQAVDANVTPTSGSSPSRSVCWLVGRAGLVAITVDEGRSWQRLRFPSDLDLRAVRATDDQAAIVIASDGSVFRTSDRGRTWRR